MIYLKKDVRGEVKDVRGEVPRASFQFQNDYRIDMKNDRIDEN